MSLSSVSFRFRMMKLLYMLGLCAAVSGAAPARSDSVEGYLRKGTRPPESMPELRARYDDRLDMKEARALFERWEDREALALYRRIPEGDARYGEARNKIGCIERTQREWKRAMRQAAAEMWNTESGFFHLLAKGFLEHRAGNHAEAYRLFCVALKRDPYNMSALTACVALRLRFPGTYTTTGCFPRTAR